MVLPVVGCVWGLGEPGRLDGSLRREFPTERGATMTSSVEITADRTLQHIGIVADLHPL